MLFVWIPYDRSPSSCGYYVIGDGVRLKPKTFSRRKPENLMGAGNAPEIGISSIVICRTMIAFHLTASLLHTVYFGYCDTSLALLLGYHGSNEMDNTCTIGVFGESKSELLGC